MRIYISGPISGRDAATVREEFDAAEKMILDRGHIPVNPVRIAPTASKSKSFPCRIRFIIRPPFSVNHAKSFKNQTSAGSSEKLLPRR